MENYYKKQWINLLNNNFFPSYFRKIQTIEFTEFKKIIMGMNNESEKLLKNVFLGDALVIKKVFDKKNLVKLRNNIYNIQKNEEEKNLRMLENCPNFHVSNKKNKLAPIRDNYDETAHSHYFFRWNGDNLKIFEHFSTIWELIKIFSGLNKNEFNNNTPKDLIIDRIQVLRYPLNEGYITTHCDAAAWQKLNIGICLNENNKDFNSGGLYLLDKQENKINVENNLDYGDCFCWIPTIFHGVDIPKLTGVENLNWNSDSGRWQALALTVQSHCIEKRLLSTGYDKFKKDPSKYKERYRNACKL